MSLPNVCYLFSSILVLASEKFNWIVKLQKELSCSAFSCEWNKTNVIWISCKPDEKMKNVKITKF